MVLQGRANLLTSRVPGRHSFVGLDTWKLGDGSLSVGEGHQKAMPGTHTQFMSPPCYAPRAMKVSGALRPLLIFASPRPSAEVARERLPTEPSSASGARIRVLRTYQFSRRWAKRREGGLLTAWDPADTALGTGINFWSLPGRDRPGRRVRGAKLMPV